MQAIAKIFVVVALLATNMSVSLAGPDRGPVAGVRRVSAFSSMDFVETLRGNEFTTVTIAGDGDTDLDIYVWDANGNLVARAIGLTDRESVSFVPNFTSTYRIEIRNLGNVWNQFAISIR